MVKFVRGAARSVAPGVDETNILRATTTDIGILAVCNAKVADMLMQCSWYVVA